MDGARGNSLSFNPHKISIFKGFRVLEMSDCHPFATLILKNITEHKKSTEPVELLPDRYKHKYCEACRNRQAQKVKNGLKAAAGIAGTAACFAVTIVTAGKINPKK